jgi:hypothetical protein
VILRSLGRADEQARTSDEQFGACADAGAGAMTIVSGSESDGRHDGRLLYSWHGCTSPAARHFLSNLERFLR